MTIKTKNKIHFIALFFIFIITNNTHATCYKVQGYGTNPATITNAQILNTEGVALAWQWASDARHGNLGFPNVINARISPFSPMWSVFAETTAPFSQYASNTQYNPETVLYRCAPTDAVDEIYIYSDVYGANAATAAVPGHPGLYAHRWSLVATRITNLANGNDYSQQWQSRRLTGLDLDHRGYQLVKVKNLSAVRFQFVNSDTIGAGGGTNTAIGTPGLVYNYNAAVAWVAIRGPGLSTAALADGDPQGAYGVYGYDFVASINPAGNLFLMRYPTCKILNNTPQVTFPNISTADLNNGIYPTGSVSLSYECEAAASNPSYLNTANITGTAQGNTALGFKISDIVVQKSMDLNLNVGTNKSISGVSHLISQNYGQPGIASGVGVRIYRGTTPLTWLAYQNTARGDGVANQYGWYPLLGPTATSSAIVDGVQQHSETFEVRLEKIPNETVTPGSFYSTAEVIISVQ